MNTEDIALRSSVAAYPGRDIREQLHYRLCALWYFTILMIVWNILGHTVLGFEQPWASPIVAVATALGVHFLLEWVTAKANGQEPRYCKGWLALADFLPPALIAGFACGMLIYTNDRMSPLIFAVVASLGSKLLFRVYVPGRGSCHVFNPSNFGVVLTLHLFPLVGFAPPYHFTTNLGTLGNFLLPGAILATGILIHALFTDRLPVVIAWLVGFFVQGIIRARLVTNGWDDWASSEWYVPLMPMTSAAFILFTLYMIPDPVTTPSKWPRQIAFGLAVAAAYGVSQYFNRVFGLFLALFVVSAIRGLWLWWRLQEDQGDLVGLEAVAPTP
jgi:enediyne biosynthesis protein E5